MFFASPERQLSDMNGHFIKLTKYDNTVDNALLIPTFMRSR